MQVGRALRGRVGRTGTRFIPGRKTRIQSAATPANATMADPVKINSTEVATRLEDRPSAGRSGAAMVALPPGHKYCALSIGGYAEFPNTSQDSEAPPVTRREIIDAYGFDMAAGKWEAIQYAAGELPPARMAHQAAVVGNALYLIGGWGPALGPDNQFLSDIWRLDLSTWAWSKVEAQGETLPKISRFQATAVGDKLYIHHHACSDHILVLDLSHADKPQLSKVAVSGDVPASRGLHTMTYLPAVNRLVVFGGAPQSGPMFGDLYELDLGSMAWSRKEVHGGRQPHSRCSHVAGALPDGKRMAVIGGSYYKDEVQGGGGLQALDDVVIYDAESCTWHWPDVSSSSWPSPRNAAAMVAVHPDNSDQQAFLFHSGWLAFQKTYNDTYIIRAH